MKEIKMYQCEICGEAYNDEQKARDCENSHINKFEIHPVFQPYTLSLDGFPLKIELTSPDWEKAIYKREYR